jgi:ubiquitin-protein ligase
MHESPRIRRLRNDLAALDRLRSESSLFQFQAVGSPPYHYQIVFKGGGLRRENGKVKPSSTHRVEIKLGASYPRTIPEIRWLSPIYHPNISEIGMVCLGGYGTHWVPSVQLDELCTMLWDMARYHNYDIRSPYNRDAALWVANQTSFLFPTDPRPLRDLRAAQGRKDSSTTSGSRNSGGGEGNGRFKPGNWGRQPSRDVENGLDVSSAVDRVRQFLKRYGRDSSEPAAVESRPLTPTAQAIAAAPDRTAGSGLLEARHDPAAAAVDRPIDLVEPLPGGDDGLIILEEPASPPPPAQPRHSLPGGEDIVFID